MNEVEIPKLEEEIAKTNEILRSLHEKELEFERQGGWRYRLKKWYYYRVYLPFFYATKIRLPF